MHTQKVTPMLMRLLLFLGLVFDAFLGMYIHMLSFQHRSK